MATKSGRSKQLGPGILPCKVVCGCAGLPSFPRAPLWVFTMPPTRDPFPRLKSDNDDSYLGKLQASQVLWFLAQSPSRVDDTLFLVTLRGRVGNLKDCGEDTESGTREVCFLPASMSPHPGLLMLQSTFKQGEVEL